MEKMSRIRRNDVADTRSLKNHQFNGTHFSPSQQGNGRSVIDRKSGERRKPRLELTVDDINFRDEDEETLSDSSGERMGLCSTCNLAIVETNGKSSSKGPLLCHRCIKRLDSQTDVNCTYCHSESQYSESVYSQDTNDYRQKLCTTRTYNVPELALGSESPDYFTRASMEVNQRTLEFSKAQSSYNWQPNPNEGRHRRTPRSNGFQMSCHSMPKRAGDTLTSNTSELKVNFQTLECSRRPIRCPRVDCAVNVAFSALTHHFLFDHPEVPIISLDPGMKSTVVFGYSTFACDSSRCLALLLVSDKLPEGAARLFNGSQIHAKYRNRLPMPVLTARLRQRSCYVGSGNGEQEDIRDERDVIIVWIAGLDMGNAKTGSLRCSIQVEDSIENESTRSLIYTGPINSLRTAQSPREVFAAGDCLILHEGFLGNVTSDTNNLNLNLVVH